MQQVMWLHPRFATLLLSAAISYNAQSAGTFARVAFQCLKKGGDRCFALEGDNEFLAIFDNQTCPIVHASTMATPLMAMNAELVLTSRRGTRTVRLEERVFCHAGKRRTPRKLAASWGNYYRDSRPTHECQYSFGTY